MRVRDVLNWILEMPVPGELPVPTPTPPIPPPPPPATPRVGILCPLYAYPDAAGVANWNKLTAAAASGVPVVAIAPGSARTNAAYPALIAQALAAGVKVLGYVPTDYGRLAIADVKANVDRWRTSFPAISGIFFDEQPSEPASAPLYASFFAHARATIPKCFVGSNPGTGCHSDYYTLGRPDILVLVETATSAVQIPSWAVAAPDGYFAALVHGVDEARMRLIVAGLKSAGVGYVYVTDDADANVWNRLPIYWDAEVAAVRSIAST